MHMLQGHCLPCKLIAHRSVLLLQERAIAAINKMLSSQEAADTVLAQLDQLVDVPKPDIQEEDLQSLELGLPLLELLLDKGDELVQQIHKGIMVKNAALPHSACT